MPCTFDRSSTDACLTPCSPPNAFTAPSQWTLVREATGLREFREAYEELKSAASKRRPAREAGKRARVAKARRAGK